MNTISRYFYNIKFFYRVWRLGVKIKREYLITSSFDFIMSMVGEVGLSSSRSSDALGANERRLRFMGAEVPTPSTKFLSKTSIVACEDTLNNLLRCADLDDRQFDITSFPPSHSSDRMLEICASKEEKCIIIDDLTR